MEKQDEFAIVDSGFYLEPVALLPPGDKSRDIFGGHSLGGMELGISR